MAKGYEQLALAALLAIVLDIIIIWALNDVFDFPFSALVIAIIIGFVVFLAIWAAVFDRLLTHKD